MSPREQFLLFHTIFSINISNYRSEITCSFVKFVCSIGVFLHSANLICRNTDISKCFRGFLRLRDNESRLYLLLLLSPCNDNDLHNFTNVFIFAELGNLLS